LRNRTGWQYAAAGLFIAGIAAVVSYRDGLFVARLAGNHDDQAYLYPFLPDGLIVVCLLALYEASRARVKRSRWAMGGLVLGIALTLAQNVYAGLAHSILDAVLDGMVPVVFFIAVEVVLWHVRRGRGPSPARGSPAALPACPHKVGDPADAIRVAVEHARECLDEKVTIRGLSRQTGIDHRKLSVLARAAPLERGRGGPVHQATAPAAAPAGAPPTPAGVSPNGRAHGS
jgi:hypothetical protein